MSLELSEKKVIGQQFKTLRIENGYTQKELADLIGVSFQTIQKYEKGLITPNLDIIHTYCTIFTKKPGYFLSSVMPLNTGDQSFSEQKLDIRSALTDIAYKLDAYEPVEIPVYAQRDHRIGVDKEMAYDYVYFSRQRLAGRDNLFIMQAQMNCLYPDIKPNDRMMIDPDLDMAEGLAIIQLKNKPRKAFKSRGSSVVRLVENDGKFFYVNNRKEGTQISQEPRPLLAGEYQGMIIQISRGLDYLGTTQAYQPLPVSTEV